MIHSENIVEAGSLRIGRSQKLTIIAGPCVIEGEKMVMETAEALKQMTAGQNFQYIFKASFRKANRTSVEGFTGLEFEKALTILDRVRSELELPVLTDVHNELEIPVVAQAVDILQIPAFLSRQTDLLLRAGRTGRIVNIKKGQFLAPEDMKEAAGKVSSTGNHKILLTERGSSFGYRNLVVDMRSLLIMAETGYPVIYDATHSVQLPGGMGKASGGQPEYILPLLRAALATGVLSGIFMEVHPNPEKALSDAASQLALEKFSDVLRQIEAVHHAVSELNI